MGSTQWLRKIVSSQNKHAGNTHYQIFMNRGGKSFPNCPKEHYMAAKETKLIRSAATLSWTFRVSPPNLLIQIARGGDRSFFRYIPMLIHYSGKAPLRPSQPGIFPEHDRAPTLALSWIQLAAVTFSAKYSRVS